MRLSDRIGHRVVAMHIRLRGHCMHVVPPCVTVLCASVSSQIKRRVCSLDVFTARKELRLFVWMGGVPPYISFDIPTTSTLIPGDSYQGTVFKKRNNLWRTSNAVLLL